MIKGSILQENITILKMYAPNNIISKYMKQILIELQEANINIIVKDFNFSLSEMDKSNRKEISKDILKLNSTIINQLDIIDICRQHYPAAAEYTFFSSLWSIHQEKPHSGP